MHSSKRTRLADATRRAVIEGGEPFIIGMHHQQRLHAIRYSSWATPILQSRIGRASLTAGVLPRGTVTSAHSPVDHAFMLQGVDRLAR